MTARRVLSLLALTGLAVALPSCGSGEPRPTASPAAARFAPAARGSPTPPTVDPRTARSQRTGPVDAPSAAELAHGVLIDVGGRRLYLACRGKGGPTVVLEAGAGSTSTTWRALWPRLVAEQRTCVYDRAGHGRSDRGPVPHTGTDTVADLHRLLVRAGLRPPYVLVGHSLGGLYARLFAGQHREDLAGLVLVDPLPAERGLLDLLPAHLQQIVRGDLAAREGLDVDTLLGEVASAGRLSDLPLVVISAGRREVPAGVPPAFRGALAAAWRAGQGTLAGLSSRGRLMVAERSGHSVQHDQPALVLQAVRSVIEEAGRA